MFLNIILVLDKVCLGSFSNVDCLFNILCYVLQWLEKRRKQIMLSMSEQETTKFTERFQCLLLLKNSRNLRLHKFEMQKKNSDVAVRKKIISCLCEMFLSSCTAVMLIGENFQLMDT